MTITHTLTGLVLFSGRSSALATDMVKQAEPPTAELSSVTAAVWGKGTVELLVSITGGVEGAGG